MNITNCVKCGGNVRSETIGWICENCKGFIDMDGNYHPHVEKPFMPPMTNGDRIRAMTDEELAEILGIFIRNGTCLDSSQEACADCVFYDFCQNTTVEDVREWLKLPAKDM